MIIAAERSAEVAALLARAFKHDTSGGGYTVDDAMASTHVYSMRDTAGTLKLAWAMDIRRDRKGVRAYVTACAGEGMQQALPECERIAREHGANRLGLRTMRPGMVKRMTEAGFVPRFVELEKEL